MNIYSSLYYWQFLGISLSADSCIWCLSVLGNLSFYHGYAYMCFFLLDYKILKELCFIIYFSVFLILFMVHCIFQYVSLMVY